MKKTLLLLTLILLTLSCNNEPTNTETNEVETIHGFVRTLVNSQTAGMLGDTALNEFQVTPGFEAVVYSNPAFESGAVTVDFFISENGSYRISIVPAVASNQLRADIDSLPGISISDYPSHTEMSTNIVFDREMQKGSNSIMIDCADFSTGFNIVKISRKEIEDEKFYNIASLPVFVMKYIE